MSWEIYLQAFDGGEEGQPNGHSIRAILDPLIARREPDAAFVEIATSDGGAAIYGYVAELSDGLMITEIAGDEIWQVVFDLLEKGLMVAMPVGSPVCIPENCDVTDLPDALREDAGVVVVRSAADLAAAALGHG